MIRKTTSAAWPPIWSPKLPPPRLIMRGGPHGPFPPSVRQATAPLPQRPPKPRANFLTLGTTARHLARSMRLRGIDASFISRNSWRTSRQARSRLSSLDSAMPGEAARRQARSRAAIFWLIPRGYNQIAPRDERRPTRRRDADAAAGARLPAAARLALRGRPRPDRPRHRPRPPEADPPGRGPGRGAGRQAARAPPGARAGRSLRRDPARAGRDGDRGHHGGHRRRHRGLQLPDHRRGPAHGQRPAHPALPPPAEALPQVPPQAADRGPPVPGDGRHLLHPGDGDERPPAPGPLVPDAGGYVRGDVPLRPSPGPGGPPRLPAPLPRDQPSRLADPRPDRKSTRLNSSHVEISYAVFCLKKKKNNSSPFQCNKKKKSTFSDT